MEQATATSTSELSARVLADMKTELARLTSYTSELGEARASAISSQRAAGEVLRLVEQLGDLQRTQISDLKIDSDSTLELYRETLAEMTDAWGRKWSGEATKSLDVLDSIVGRQHQLAVELTEFQEAMRSASSFAEAQQGVKSQVMQLDEAVRQGSATFTSSLEEIAAVVEQQGGTLRSTLLQAAAEHSVALNGLTSAIRGQQEKLETELALLTSRSADLEASIKDHGKHAAEQVNHLGQLLRDMREVQTAALEASGQKVVEVLEAQSIALDEVRKAVLSEQSGSRRWNALTVLVVFGTLLVFQLFRSF